MPNLIAETLTKTSAESVAYGFDFSKLCASGETISGVTSVTATTGDGALTIGSGAASGTDVTVRIAGGTSGVKYRIKCVVTTSASNTRVGLGDLDVNDG